jgi:hypothetical protein
MAKIRATIEFQNSDGSARRYQIEMDGARDRGERSAAELARRAFAELQKDSFHGKATRAEFQFDDLYELATKTFEHYLKLLRDCGKSQSSIGQCCQSNESWSDVTPC